MSKQNKSENGDGSINNKTNKGGPKKNQKSNKKKPSKGQNQNKQNDTKNTQFKGLVTKGPLHLFQGWMNDTSSNRLQQQCSNFIKLLPSHLTHVKQYEWVKAVLKMIEPSNTPYSTPAPDFSKYGIYELYNVKNTNFFLMQKIHRQTNQLLNGQSHPSAENCKQNMKLNSKHGKAKITWT